MSSSVISAKGESIPSWRRSFSSSTFRWIATKTLSRSWVAFQTRSLTRPSDERSSKMMTRITRWSTMAM
jgi:hypothetical protein